MSISYGEFDFDAGFDRGRRHDGATVAFTRSEARVIAALVRSSGRVVSRGQILDALSEEGSDKNDRNVDFIINRLRRKLGDNPRAARYIATRYGGGYAWVAAPMDRRLVAAGADVVIGPLRGLRHLAGAEAAARRFAGLFHARFRDICGADRRVVFDPDCPPLSAFAADPPRIAIALNFFRVGAALDCVVQATAFESGHTYSLTRHEIPTGHDDAAAAATTGELVARLASDIWKALTITSRARAPLPVAMHDAAQSLRGPQPGWAESNRSLSDLAARNPNDPALQIMLAVNIHSKYVQHGLELFAAGADTCAADEARIEELVTANLPFVEQDPFLAASAADLLFFLGGGYRQPAIDLIERVTRTTTAVAPALIVLGAIRYYTGRVAEGVHALDQALDLAEPGSELEVYILCLKCQAFMAVDDRPALDAVLSRLYALRPTIRFVYDIFYGQDGAPSPAAAMAMQNMTVAQARGMLVFADYLCGRHFDDPAHRRNTLRAPLALLGGHFGPALLGTIDVSAPSGR